MQREELERNLEKLHAASFRWALSCTRDRADAEDSLQTAYLKVLGGRARFEGRSAFKTWLFAVIRKTAAERRRSFWSRLMAGNGGGISTTVADPGPGPLAEAARSEEVARLKAALARLPRRQRQMLELVFSHDMTVEEASAALGIGVGSGRVHYHRGKKRLLTELGGRRNR
jgi:RNA polymerase sigma-70 factor (ECF subfamily)